MNRRDALKLSNAALTTSLFSALPGEALAKSGASAFEPVIKYLAETDAVADKLGYTDPVLRGAYRTQIMASLAAAIVDVFGTRVENPSWVPFLPYFLPYVGPNPDTIYSFAPVEPQGIYRISGRNGTETISTITLATGGDHIGKILGTTVGEIDRLTLNTDADGNYSFILSAKPAPEHPGQWIELPAKTTALMSRRVIKEISQTDGLCAIERLDRSVARLDYSTEEVTHRIQMAADCATMCIRFSLDYMHLLRKRGAADGLIIDDQTPYGGLVSQIYFFHLFKLEKDEILIFESDVPAAKYWSLVIFDPINTTLDFVQHQSSLNDRQVHLDVDGRIRVVLAPTDPGTANWLDTGGWLQGGIIWRWNDVKTKPQPTLNKVKLNDLKNHLPTDTRYFTPAERRVQLSARKVLYQRRVH